MALVEAHPFAYQIEEFAYNLRDYLVGLNLGRWDYMASLIHFNLEDPAWVLPDRNTIPHRRRVLSEPAHADAGDLPQARHARDRRHDRALPSREDAELNERALACSKATSETRRSCCMDGAWTGHPDQNAIAVAQFPVPNQLERVDDVDLHPDMRPSVARRRHDDQAGTRAAVRTVIRYRNGYLKAGARACSTATWKTSQPIASTGS